MLNSTLKKLPKSETDILDILVPNAENCLNTSIDELSEKTGISREDIIGCLHSLRNKGYEISIENPASGVINVRLVKWFIDRIQS